MKKRPRRRSDSTQNPEKAVIIGALREKYALPMLLTYFHMARITANASSCH